MNLNLAWELWKDVKIYFLQYMYKVLPPFAIILTVSFIWNLTSVFGFLLFWGLEILTKDL